MLEKKKNYWKKQRLKVLSYYSNNKLECACCEEVTYEFLVIDHIDGGGTQHRKSLGSKYIYSWLIQQEFPKGFQVLCHNCNSARAFYKECPHTKYKEQLLARQFNESSTSTL